MSKGELRHYIFDMVAQPACHRRTVPGSDAKLISKIFYLGCKQITCRFELLLCLCKPAFQLLNFLAFSLEQLLGGRDAFLQNSNLITFS